MSQTIKIATAVPVDEQIPYNTVIVPNNEKIIVSRSRCRTLLWNTFCTSGRNRKHRSALHHR